MQLPEYLTQSTDGEIRIVGHRIGLYHLLQRYNEGESAEMLASHYPTLPLSLVHRLLAFYLDNQSDIDAYLDRCAAATDEQQRNANRIDLNALRNRLANPQSPTPQAHVG
jgi:uncharacterized protein (DUF433 family)